MRRQSIPLAQTPTHMVAYGATGAAKSRQPTDRLRKAEEVSLFEVDTVRPLMCKAQKLHNLV